MKAYQSEVQVETRDVSDDAAVVVVTTVVENESLTTARTTVITEIVDADGTVVGRDVAPLTMFEIGRAHV